MLAVVAPVLDLVDEGLADVGAVHDGDRGALEEALAGGQRLDEERAAEADGGRVGHASCGLDDVGAVDGAGVVVDDEHDELDGLFLVRRSEGPVGGQCGGLADEVLLEVLSEYEWESGCKSEMGHGC